jgi:large subunit ribosomal protein L4e
LHTHTFSSPTAKRNKRNTPTDYTYFVGISTR